MTLEWKEFRGGYSARYKQMELTIRTMYASTPEYKHDPDHWGPSLTTKYKKEYCAEAQFISHDPYPWWCSLIHSATLSMAKETCEDWITNGGYEEAIAQILEKELDK